MGRDFKRYGKALIEKHTLGAKGQSTIEFAVVMAGFLSITIALILFWKRLDEGIILEHAISVASHHIQLISPVIISDIFLY